MNKYLEALDIIKRDYAYNEVSKKEFPTVEEVENAIEELEELVDKETSMEVNMEDYHLEYEYQYPIYSCPKCGKHINDEDNYCRHCGQRVYFEECEE